MHPRFIIGFIKLRLLSWLGIGSVKMKMSARVAWPVHLSRKNRVMVGANVFVAQGAWFGANVEICQDVLIGPRVAFVGGDHKIPAFPGLIRLAGRAVVLPIVIQEGAWIGYGSIIMHGVTIGRGAIVGAGSVVTNDVPPGGVVGGCPARMISRRKGAPQ